MFKSAFIPYRGYFCSPFSRWQGSFQTENAIVLAAQVVKKGLEERGIQPGWFDGLFLGFSIPQERIFYGAPWLAGLIGAEGVSGPMFSQACATAATELAHAALCVEQGVYQAVLAVTADRCSNGPHLVYPNPTGPGGMPVSEDWVMRNFNEDPWARNAMIQTAENVAREEGITRKECDELTLKRYLQYLDSLANDRAFQKKYMAPVELRAGKKTVVVDGDEGITECTEEGLARLKPVLSEGVHSFGSQTHPADGNATVVVATREKAREMSLDKKVTIGLLSYGYARAKKGFMAQAVAPAAQRALESAGIRASDLKAVKTHNPFAVNDVHMIRKMGLNPEIVNNYGSSLIFGHPQAPTGARCTMELIEELVERGGGYGLFAGCAAGDTAAALVLKVE